MFYLTIHGNRGGVEAHTFIHSTLMNALMEVAHINDARRWSGLGNARFTLVRKPAPWQQAAR